MQQQDFSEYIDFLKNVSAEEEKICEEESALNICTYILEENEIPGEVVNWVLQYLTVKNCPKALVAPIINNIVAVINENCIQSPQDNGYDSEKNGFSPLSLHKNVFVILRDFCQKLLDNSELDEILQDQNESFVEYPKCVAGAVKNVRRSMEDRHILIENFNEVFNVLAKETEKSYFYGVFDGHDGSHAAYYSVSQLPILLAKDINYPQDPEVALRNAFKRTDDGFSKKCKSQRMKGGTTALCALYRPVNSTLYIAWVGDSKALIAKKGQMTQIVIPHKPENPDETLRIENNGGFVVPYAGSYRVNGLLSVSRAIGDSRWKSCVISDPDIVSLELDKDEDFLVLATDGLWDFVSESDITYVIYKELRLNIENLNEIPQRLMDLAKLKGSSDNISIIVVFLKDPNQIAKDSWPLDGLEESYENAFKGQDQNQVNSFLPEQSMDVDENLKDDYYEEKNHELDGQEKERNNDDDVLNEEDKKHEIQEGVENVQDVQKSFDFDMEPETCVDTLKVITNETMMSSSCEFGETLHKNVKISPCSNQQSGCGIQFDNSNSLSADDFTDNSATRTNLVVSSDVMAAELNSPFVHGSLLSEEDIVQKSQFDEININLLNKTSGEMDENTVIENIIAGGEPKITGNALVESSTSERECSSIGERQIQKNAEFVQKTDEFFNENLFKNNIQFDDESFMKNNGNLLLENDENQLIIENKILKNEKDGDSFVENLHQPPTTTAMATATATATAMEVKSEEEKLHGDFENDENEKFDGGNNNFNINENFDMQHSEEEKIQTLIGFSFDSSNQITTKSMDSIENLKNLQETQNIAISNENRPHPHEEKENENENENVVGVVVGAESDEESEDEWKYLKTKEEIKCVDDAVRVVGEEKSNLILQQEEQEEKKVIESFNENNYYINDENNLPKNKEDTQEKEPEKDFDTSELKENMNFEDMATSQLNPEAKEFIPSSPILSVNIPPVIGIPVAAVHGLTNDDVVAQSPRKGVFSMEDFPVPNENEFEREILHRPSEFNENFDDSCANIESSNLDETPLMQDTEQQNENLLMGNDEIPIHDTNVEKIENFFDKTEDMLNTVQPLQFDIDSNDMCEMNNKENDPESLRVSGETQLNRDQSTGIETSDDISPLSDSFVNDIQSKINLETDLIQQTVGSEQQVPNQYDTNPFNENHFENRFVDEQNQRNQAERVNEEEEPKQTLLTDFTDHITASAPNETIQDYKFDVEPIVEKKGFTELNTFEADFMSDVVRGFEEQVKEPTLNFVDQTEGLAEEKIEIELGKVADEIKPFKDETVNEQIECITAANVEDLKNVCDDVKDIKPVEEIEIKAFSANHHEDFKASLIEDVQVHEEIVTPSTPSVDAVEISESEKTTDTTPIEALVMNDCLKQKEEVKVEVKEEPKPKKEVAVKADKAKPVTSATRKATATDASKTRPATGAAMKNKPSTLSAPTPRPRTAPSATKALSPSEKKATAPKPKIEVKSSSAVASAAKKPLATKTVTKTTESTKSAAPPKTTTTARVPSATKTTVPSKTAATVPSKQKLSTNVTTTKTVNQSTTSPNPKISSTTATTKKSASPRTTIPLNMRKAEGVKSSLAASPTKTATKPHSAKIPAAATTKSTATMKTSSTNAKSTTSTTTITRKVPSTIGQKKPITKPTTKGAAAVPIKTEITVKSKQSNTNTNTNTTSDTNNHIGTEIKINGTKTD